MYDVGYLMSTVSGDIDFMYDYHDDGQKLCKRQYRCYVQAEHAMHRMCHWQHMLNDSSFVF